MAKVYPQHLPTTSSSSNNSNSINSKETYTIWTKSLICHGNGCTVFDSRGQVVYRVDNYGIKKSRQVYLMDLHGNVLFSLLKSCTKKLYIGNGNGCWNGYKGSPNDDQDTLRTRKKEIIPWFQTRKNSSKKSSLRNCHVIMGCDYESKESSYRIEETSGAGKAAFVIRDSHGDLVAQVKQKESSCGGVLLGEDVLSLVVEPHEDHSLVMAIVIVYGLMTNIIM
ncbi:protein LURP-one-related 4-like [Impatiens glandulifera]|uniref:protein LURP-one-related 4-like n=1 Tax=Impatiens glandulifera TaxID=253017 RepID=UPI001FB0CB03|nr:protein LURP-one-related 4-like [Impatiens glandulifera]